MNAWKKEHGCSIENYIKEDKNMEYSICREERQYAVFLYNILRKYAHENRESHDKIHQIITENCGIPEKADIKHVFYEVTFMRDFFERNRRIYWEGSKENKLLQKTFSPSKRELKKEESFNYKLIQYVCKAKNVKLPEELFEWKNQRENNLGRNKIENFDDMGEIQSVICEMMEAKPDLAVIYQTKQKDDLHEAGKNYLLFLECKFESGECSYKGGNRQCEIQGKIADFLCNYYLKEKDNKDNIDVSPIMKNNSTYASQIVHFIRQKKESDKHKEAENVILISDLIELNNNIFNCHTKCK